MGKRAYFGALAVAGSMLAATIWWSVTFFEFCLYAAGSGAKPNWSGITAIATIVVSAMLLLGAIARWCWLRATLRR
jgi:hypothetical protein